MKSLIKIKFMRTFSLLIAVSLLIVSCKKGDTGPAGPKGTANVIYSGWFTPAAYKKDTIFGSYGFYYDNATTDITQQALDSGTVLTFGKLDGYNPVIWPTNQVAQLPISLVYENGTTGNVDVWSALATPGNLRIQLVSSTNAYSSISNAHQFRYVIIPGGTRSAVASFKPGVINEVIQNYRLMSYSEICQRLGIPE
jgi:hypothetical protein